jgi:hypothetical protein
MNTAVNCIDYGPSDLPTEYEDFPAAAKRASEFSPTFGASVATGLLCALWEAEPDPLAAPDDTGAPPILVISTTGDPATPYEWGVAVARQLGNAALLTYRGEGHTVYGGQDACVDAAVDAYLIDLELPDEGAECGDGPPPPNVSSPSTPAPGSTPAPPPGRPGNGLGADEPHQTDLQVADDGGVMWLAFGMVVIAGFAVAAAGVVVYAGVRRF